MLHGKPLCNDILYALIGNHPHPSSLSLICSRIGTCGNYVSEQIQLLIREGRITKEQTALGTVYRPCAEDIKNAKLWPTPAMTAKELGASTMSVNQIVNIKCGREPAGVYVPRDLWVKLIKHVDPAIIV